MGDEENEARDVFPEAIQTGRATSPPSGLRQRPLGRAATFAETTPRFARRGSSFVSETLSESRRSLKESTDDLLLPRASIDHDIHSDSSHWHSLPLGLALLPAIAGVFFQNGSKVVTDLSLLALATLFLNWAVRLPWEWYLSAQAVVLENEKQELGSAIEDESSDVSADGTLSPQPKRGPKILSDRAIKAQHELRVYEVLALLACFVFPALSAWLLHAIRAQLTPRSESLISNYNLTIFLLASEVRPMTHLIKLVQRRTLFLQRTVSASSALHEDQAGPKVADLTKRLEELEAHVANTVMTSTQGGPGSPSSTDDLIAQASAQANAEIRKTFQPELEALNRAMRRYEKSKMTYAIQIDTRLQEIEARLSDTMILTAATQRNADKQSGRYTTVLLNWVSACIVVPVTGALYVLKLPHRTLSLAISWIKRGLGIAPTSRAKEGKVGSRSSQVRRTSKERGKSTQ